MNTMGVRRAVTMAAACGAAALLAGCTTVMAGTAARDPGFVPGSVTPVLLQHGNYPIKTGKPPAPGGEVSTIIEAQRMADFVVYPWEVYPSATDSDQVGTAVIKSPKALNLEIPGPAIADIATANGFINGFTTSRGTPQKAPGKHMAVNIMVLRFPGPDQANAAAAAFAAQKVTSDGSTDVHPMVIPGHPEAGGLAQTLSSGRPSVQAFTAHGPYVFFVFTQTDDTADAAAAAVGKALDLQGPRIDQFQPTDPAQFATMNTDPAGLLVRTLPPSGSASVNNGVYGPKGMLHFSAGSDPQVAADRFTKYGIDAIAMEKTTVYKTKDASAATDFAAIVAKELADGATPGPVVPGFPAAKCFTVTNPGALDERIQCVATADRYLYTVFSKQSNDAIQQTSAQYLLLVGK